MIRNACTCTTIVVWHVNVSSFAQSELSVLQFVVVDTLITVISRIRFAQIKQPQTVSSALLLPECHSSLDKLDEISCVFLFSCYIRYLLLSMFFPSPSFTFHSIVRQSSEGPSRSSASCVQWSSVPLPRGWGWYSRKMYLDCELVDTVDMRPVVGTLTGAPSSWSLSTPPPSTFE